MSVLTRMTAATTMTPSLTCRVNRMNSNTSHQVTSSGVLCVPRQRHLGVDLNMMTTRRRNMVVVHAVKKWIKPEINKNTGKAVRKEMHVREGDTVKVISGKDKGKVGEVVKVYRKGLKAGKILVDDVNLMKKTQKPRQGGEEEKGKIILTESPIHHSNVMLYSKEKQQVSRVGHKIVDGKKLRYLIKTGEVLQEKPIVKTQAATTDDNDESDA